MPPMVPHSSRGFRCFGLWHCDDESVAEQTGPLLGDWEAERKEQGVPRGQEHVPQVIHKDISPKRSTNYPPPQTTKPSTHDLSEEI